MKESQEWQLEHAQLLHKECMGSCVGSDMRIGSWSMTTYCMYTRADSCVYTDWTQKAAEILFHGWGMVTPIGYFSKMPQARTMHDKPAHT